MMIMIAPIWLRHVARDILDWHCGDGCTLVMILPTSIVILKILVMLMAMATVVEMLMVIAIDMTMLVEILMMSLAIAMLIRQDDLHIMFAYILYLKWWQSQQVWYGVIKNVIKHYSNHDKDRNGIMTVFVCKAHEVMVLLFAVWLLALKMGSSTWCQGWWLQSRICFCLRIGHAMSVLCDIVEDAWAYFPPFVNLTFAWVCVCPWLSFWCGCKWGGFEYGLVLRVWRIADCVSSFTACVWRPAVDCDA
jgi:hypothetical protein